MNHEDRRTRSIDWLNMPLAPLQQDLYAEGSSLHENAWTHSATLFHSIPFVMVLIYVTAVEGWRPSIGSILCIEKWPFSSVTINSFIDALVLILFFNSPISKIFFNCSIMFYSFLLLLNSLKFSFYLNERSKRSSSTVCIRWPQI